MFSNLKMPLTDALATSLIGITTVIIILAIIAALITFETRIIRPAITARMQITVVIPIKEVARAFVISILCSSLYFSDCVLEGVSCLFVTLVKESFCLSGECDI